MSAAEKYPNVDDDKVKDINKENEVNFIFKMSATAAYTWYRFILYDIIIDNNNIIDISRQLDITRFYSAD